MFSDPLSKLQLLSYLMRKGKQTVGKRKQMTPKLWLLPYPVVGVYSGRINSPLCALSSCRQCSGVCSGMWLSSVSPGYNQAVL